MVIFSALVALWTLFPVLAAVAIALASRKSWDSANALIDVQVAEIGDWSAVEVIDRAATEATILVTLAARAERLYGDRFRAAQLRNVARRTLSHAWEVSSRAAMLPFAVGALIAAMHASPAPSSDAPSFIPASVHCTVRDNIQGSGSARMCVTMPAIRCSVSNGVRLCHAVK